MNTYNDLKEILSIEYDLTMDLIESLLNEFKQGLKSFNECVRIAKLNDGEKD